MLYLENWRSHSTCNIEQHVERANGEQMLMSEDAAGERCRARLVEPSGGILVGFSNGSQPCRARNLVMSVFIESTRLFLFLIPKYILLYEIIIMANVSFKNCIQLAK